MDKACSSLGCTKKRKGYFLFLYKQYTEILTTETITFNSSNFANTNVEQHIFSVNI
jgi:hypothetical protein